MSRWRSLRSVGSVGACGSTDLDRHETPKRPNLRSGDGNTESQSVKGETLRPSVRFAFGGSERPNGTRVGLGRTGIASAIARRAALRRNLVVTQTAVLDRGAHFSLTPPHVARADACPHSCARLAARSAHLSLSLRVPYGTSPPQTCPPSSTPQDPPIRPARPLVEPCPAATGAKTLEHPTRLRR